MLFALEMGVSVNLLVVVVVVVDIFKTSMRPVTSSVETACKIHLT